MTERRGQENKLKTERLRQREKTAKVPESASPSCLGAPPSPRLRDPGNSKAKAEEEGEGQGWEKPWAGEAAGSQGRAEAGGPDARVLQTAPYPAQDCALGAGPGPSYPAPTGPSAPGLRSPPSERPLCGPSPRFPPAPPLPPTGTPPHCSASAPPPSPSPSLPLTSRGAAGPGVGSPARLDRNARSPRRLTARTQGRELGGLRLQNPGRVGIQSPKSRCF